MLICLNRVDALKIKYFFEIHFSPNTQVSLFINRMFTS